MMGLTMPKHILLLLDHPSLSSPNIVLDCAFGGLVALRGENEELGELGVVPEAAGVDLQVKVVTS